MSVRFSSAGDGTVANFRSSSRFTSERDLSRSTGESVHIVPMTIARARLSSGSRIDPAELPSASHFRPRHHFNASRKQLTRIKDPGENQPQKQSARDSSSSRLRLLCSLTLQLDRLLAEVRLGGLRRYTGKPRSRVHSWRTLHGRTLRPSEPSSTSVLGNNSEERMTPAASMIVWTVNEISSGILSEYHSLSVSPDRPFLSSAVQVGSRGTFAQFRVSRFTSDWHCNRRSLARTSALSMDFILPARPLRPGTRASLPVTYRPAAVSVSGDPYLKR